MAPLLQLGIVGHPVGHTLSPLLHRFLMKALNIRGDYVVYDTPPDKLEETILYLKTLGVRGVNVTIPHKVNAMACVSAVDETAKRAGAVNTLVFERTGNECEAYGYNTDVAGFIRGLPVERLAEIEEASVLVLGAGGAARAVVMALLEHKAHAITLSARSQAKAAVVLNAAKMTKRQLRYDTQMAWLPLEELVDLSPFDWVVNATSMGMHPEVAASPLTAAQLATLDNGAFVHDLIYRPAETRLLAMARQRGLQTHNGLAMLSFELWSGKTLPGDLQPLLYQTLQNALG